MSNNIPQEKTNLQTESHGKLFVISAPSGAGKSTLVHRVLKTLPDVGYSVSFTTRAPRVREVEGKDYFFVSREEFENKIEANDFLEYALVHENYYGTSRTAVLQELSAGRDVILEIDVQGAASIKKKVAEAVSIFILPPSFEVLKERLFGRATDSAENLKVRLQNAYGEVEQYKKFDYIVINDDVDRAANNLAAIFLAERSRRERQEKAAEKILSSFTD